MQNEVRVMIGCLYGRVINDEHTSPYLGQQPARYAETWLQSLDVQLCHLPLITAG